MTDTKTAAADLRGRILAVCHTYQCGSHKFNSSACQASCAIVANEILKTLADHDAALAQAVREQCAAILDRVSDPIKVAEAAPQLRNPITVSEIAAMLAKEIRVLPLPDMIRGRPRR